MLFNYRSSNCFFFFKLRTKNANISTTKSIPKSFGPCVPMSDYIVVIKPFINHNNSTKSDGINHIMRLCLSRRHIIGGATRGNEELAPHQRSKCAPQFREP